VIITERAVFRRYPEKGFLLEEVARGYSVEDIAACTDMDYAVSDMLKLDAYGPEPGD
jgi:acyl CoA:acetate/3-ketoacid CoA transferase beta subunit